MTIYGAGFNNFSNGHSRTVITKRTTTTYGGGNIFGGSPLERNMFGAPRLDGFGGPRPHFESYRETHMFGGPRAHHRHHHRHHHVRHHRDNPFEGYMLGGVANAPGQYYPGGDNIANNVLGTAVNTATALATAPINIASGVVNAGIGAVKSVGKAVGSLFKGW